MMKGKFQIRLEKPGIGLQNSGVKGAVAETCHRPNYFMYLLLRAIVAENIFTVYRWGSKKSCKFM